MFAVRGLEDELIAAERLGERVQGFERAGREGYRPQRFLVLGLILD